jgi:predicted nucleic acid-binding protein
MATPELMWNPRNHPDAIADFTRPTDAQMPACVDALAGVVGEGKASLPSWQRRLALDGTTGELVILLDVPRRWLSTGDNAYVVAPEPGPALAAWLAAEQVAWPVDTALALLAGSESPEAELERRREMVRVRDGIRAARQAEKDAKAATAAKAEAEAEERVVVYREPAWEKLTNEQRLLIAVSLRLEVRDPALAADLRELAALQGGFMPLPRTRWWLPADQRTTAE